MSILKKTLTFVLLLSVFSVFLNSYGFSGNGYELSASGNTTLIFSLTGEGSGKVVDTLNEDVVCEDESCFFSLPRGTQVNLKAYPDFTSTFNNWLVPQSCLGQEECNLTLESTHSSVWARFDMYPVEEGDEGCAEIGGRCLDMELEHAYGPCEVNEQPGRIAWDLCRFDRDLCGQDGATLDLCQSKESTMYRCCVPIDEEKNEGCAEVGGECIWLGSEDSRNDGDPCILGGEEGRIATNLCNSDPYGYYTCCVLTLELDFEASEEEITLGDSVELTWESEGATSCEASNNSDLENDWQGPRELSGSEFVKPQETTTYTLKCSSGEREVSESLTISVEGGEIELEFEANPDVIELGESSTLSWDAEGATSCWASDGWGGQKSTRGSEVVSPPETTRYTLTCENDTDEVSATVRVTVEDDDDDPVTSDRGCQEIGGHCMWVSADEGERDWWDLDFNGSGECNTGCLIGSLCRSEEQHYRDGEIYACCAPEHFCESRDDDSDGPISSGPDQEWPDPDEGEGFHGLQDTCPFLYLSEDQERREDCGLYCMEGPEWQNPDLVEHLHSKRPKGEEQDFAGLYSGYRPTGQTNSVVISHCDVSAFAAPDDGEIVSVFQIGYENDKPIDISGGIMEFQTADYLYRIEPSVPLDARWKMPDGVVQNAEVDAGNILIKLAFSSDHTDSGERYREDIECDAYGLYVQLLNVGGGSDSEICADCHFADELGCNLYSTGNQGHGYENKVDCGRCERDGGLPSCVTVQGESTFDLRCIIRGPYLENCVGSCIVDADEENYCCDCEWDECYEKVPTEDGFICVPHDNCIPIERQCPEGASCDLNPIDGSGSSDDDPEEEPEEEVEGCEMADGSMASFGSNVCGRYLGKGIFPDWNVYSCGNNGEWFSFWDKNCIIGFGKCNLVNKGDGNYDISCGE